VVAEAAKVAEATQPAALVQRTRGQPVALVGKAATAVTVVVEVTMSILPERLAVQVLPPAVEVAAQAETTTREAPGQQGISWLPM
jgi:hypothetical protein